MRLIDADKLFLHLNNWAFAEAPSDLDVGEAKFEKEVVYRTINECMQAVDEQPTAYDVDKVVKELKESLYDDNTYGCCDDLETIVKRGIIE